MVPPMVGALLFPVKPVPLGKQENLWRAKFVLTIFSMKGGGFEVMLKHCTVFSLLGICSVWRPDGWKKRDVQTLGIRGYTVDIYSWLHLDDNNKRPWWRHPLWYRSIPQRISNQMNPRNKWNKTKKMWEFLMIPLRFNQNPPTSSTTAPTPVDPRELKGTFLTVWWGIWESKYA